MWLECIGAVSGCCCKEVHRYPLVLAHFLAAGGLYLEILSRMPNRKVLEKCILCNNLLYTPQELENLGGKKAKAWKKSIKHKGKPLQKFFTSRTLQEHKGIVI